MDDHPAAPARALMFSPYEWDTEMSLPDTRMPRSEAPSPGLTERIPRPGQRGAAIPRLPHGGTDQLLLPVLEQEKGSQKLL